MDNNWSRWAERVARAADVVRHTAQRAFDALRADYVKLQEQRREDAARAARRNDWDERRVDQRRHAEDKRREEGRRVDNRRAEDHRREDVRRQGGAARGELIRQDDHVQERRQNVSPTTKHEQSQRIEQRERAPQHQNPESALQQERIVGERAPVRSVGVSHEAERERPSAKVQAQLNAVSSHARPVADAAASRPRPEPELAARRLAREWSSTRNAVQAELEGRPELWAAEPREPNTAELRAWNRLHEHARSQGLDPADAPFPDPRQVPEWNAQMQADQSSSGEADVGREIQAIDKTLHGQHTLAANEVRLDQMHSGGLDMSGRPSEEHGYITSQMRWLDGALEAHERERAPTPRHDHVFEDQAQERKPSQQPEQAPPPQARARARDDSHSL